MKRSPAQLFYKHRNLLLLSLALILVAGLSAWQVLPRLEDPIIINRFAIVITPFPGASAKRVDTQVTEKIEDVLQENAEIKELRSSSRQGFSVILIELKDEVTNVNTVWSDIRDDLTRAAATLPTGAGSPRLDDERGYAFTQMMAIKAKSKTVPFYVLKRYADDLRKRLLALPSTDIVRLFGAPEEEIIVDVNPNQLRALKLNLRQISNLVTAADSKIASGNIYQFNNNILVEISGEFTNINRIKKIPITNTADGQTVRLSDIAKIYQGFVEPISSLVRSNKQRAVVLAARIEPHQRIDLWSQQVSKILANFNKRLPANLTSQVIFSQQKYTNRRLNNLRDSLFISIFLVISVLFLTLGWRSSLIVTATLPLTSLMTLAVLHFAGIAIHQMSIIGLIVSLGLVVDNAIVIVSSMRRYMLQDHDAITAIRRTLSQYWLPLLSSTLTTILAFLPIMLLPGATGEFVGPIGFSVVCALISSYILSVTIIPAVAGKALHIKPAKLSWLNTGLSIPALANIFRHIIHFSLQHYKKTIVIAMLIPLLGLISLFLLTEQFFPRTDRNQFQIEMYLPEQSSIWNTEATIARADAILASYPEITSTHWFMGTSAPSFYYNLFQKNDSLPNYAQAIINTKRISDTDKIIPKLQNQLNTELPNAQFLVRFLWQGPPFDSPIEILLFGDNLNILQEYGEKLRLILSKIPDVTHTRNSLTLGAPKIVVKANEDVLKQLNLSLNDLANDLNQQLEGIRSGSLIQGPEELPVRVRLNRQYRENLLSLYQNYTILPANRTAQHELGIPLSSFATVSFQPSIGVITRRDGRRVNVISGFVQAGVLPATPLNAFKKALSKSNLRLPPGYSIKYGGEADERNQAVSQLFASVNIIIVLMITTIVLTFNSFRYAFIIFLVAIQAIGLGLFSLFIFNYPFGFNSIIAIMGLVGVAINAGIIIISNLQRNHRARRGDINAIANVVVNISARHIISTTLTTVLGFMPLIFTEGRLWPPFGVALAGGIGLSAIISFFFVPTSYLLLNGWLDTIKAKRQRVKAKHEM
jgi:multidrug efflux pump